ncbi:MAG: hypothetical protein APF84_10940 [Gracilibacter sp. BRH_c7a]|nr:MAG: hypothetical protein APF84_10940 [Gracilibacter sp. BRH_c7a]
MVDVFSNALIQLSSLKPYVLLPIIIFLFSWLFRLPFAKAIHSSLLIGIGFLGIFIVFGYFIESIEPALKMLIVRTGVHLNVLDVGWTPLSAIAWANKIAPIYVILIFGINLLMLLVNFTETLNIDIWNYWHFIMAGTLVYETTHNILLATIATTLAAVLTLKFADWSAPAVERLTGLSGISITTFSGQSYLPLGVIGNQIIDRVPIINKINLDSETMKNRLGILGEPITIGFVFGILLGLSAGYGIKNTMQLGVEIAGVSYLIPVMSGIIANGLIPISEGIKVFSEKKLKAGRKNYIGLHYAVLMKYDSVIVTGILLMPIALFFAFILPGANFIPFGELANISSAIVMIVVVTRGNVFRSLVIGIPIIIGKIYVASYLAITLTRLYQNPKLDFLEVEGLITSFLEGGNLLRFWIIKLCEGNTVSLLLLPVMIMMLVLSYQWFIKTQRDLINSPMPVSAEVKSLKLEK